MSTGGSQLSARLPAKPLEWRRAALGIGALATGTWVALYLTTKTSHGAGMWSVGVVVAVLAMGWMFTTRRVELALSIAVAYIGLLDGFLRLKTGSSTLTVARDAFLYSVALGMLVRAIVRRERFRWPPLTVWVVGWTAFVLVQLANPNSGPTMHRLVSLRQDLEFVPLFFLGYAVVRTKKRLQTLLILLLAIGGVNGAVGLYQSTLSPGQLAAWGPGYSNLLNPKGPLAAPTTAVGANGKPIVRPPALGGDMGFAGALGMTVLPAGIALLLIRRRNNAQRLLIGGLVILTTLGVMTSESRSAVLSAVVGLLAFTAMLAASREGKKVMVGLLVFGAVLGAALAGVSSGSLSRYDSISPDKVTATVSSARNTDLIPTYMSRFPFGAGLGASGPAFGQSGNAMNTVSGESQFTFLIGEVGIPGLLLFLAFQGRVLGGSVRRLRRVRDSETRILLAAIIAPLFAYVANWYVGTSTTSPPNAPFMWGAIGILSFWLLSRHGPADHSSA